MSLKWELIQPEIEKMMTKERKDKSDLPDGQQRSAKQAGSAKEDWIGAHLRKVYDEALSEPVPDRFLSLLQQIEKKERGS
jgi:hypothetical protein